MQEKRVANCHKNSIGPENNGLITEISIVYMRVITNMRSYFFAHFLRDIFSASSYPTSSQRTFFLTFAQHTLKQLSDMNLHFISAHSFSLSLREVTHMMSGCYRALFGP